MRPGGIICPATSGTTHYYREQETMQKVQPEFDTSTCTWFVPGMKVEAQSLRELSLILKQRKDGPYSIEGYHPKGYGYVERMSSTVSTVRPSVSTINGPRIFNSLPADRSVRQVPEEVVPPTAPQPPSAPVTIRKKVKKPKVRVGSAGARNVPTPFGGKSKYDVNGILNHWFLGLSARDIGNKYGLPRSTVCRIAFEARKRGDSRAVRRQNTTDVKGIS